VNEYISRTLDDNPRNALKILRCYLPIENTESGLVSKGGLGPIEYDSLTSAIDADIILEALHRLYGSDLESREPSKDENEYLNKNIAYQFARLHQNAKKKDKQTKQTK
jgi:hypothetical protein